MQILSLFLKLYISFYSFTSCFQHFLKQLVNNLTNFIRDASAVIISHILIWHLHSE